jgi:hypothetical protein
MKDILKDVSRLSLYFRIGDRSSLSIIRITSGGCNGHRLEFEFAMNNSAGMQ